MPCDVPRQSGGSTQIPYLTGYEPKSVEFKDIDAEAISPEDLESRRIELDRNFGTDPSQIHERFVKCRKVGADVSYFQSQMHSEYDSAERIADSDFEDGNFKKMLAAPLYLQNREDYESSRMPIATEKRAALFQERGASAKRTQADLRKSLMSSSSQEPSAPGKRAALLHMEMKNPEINSRVLFSKTLTRQIWEDLFLKATKIICICSVKQNLNLLDRNIKFDLSIIA